MEIKTKVPEGLFGRKEVARKLKVLAIFISNNWEKQGLLYPEIS